MKKNDIKKEQKIPLSFALNICIMFTVLSLLFNIIYSLMLWPLLPNIGFNLLTLLISFVPALVFVIIKSKLKKPLINTKAKIIYYISFFYTSIFIIFNISTIFFKDVWNLYTILIIFVLSIVISIIRLYLPIKNYLIRAIIYFVVFAIPYFIITLSVEGLGKGNAIIIVFSVYALIYIASSISIYLIIKTREKSSNSKKAYTKMFK